MNAFNPEIHHRRSIRLKGYDYSQPGAYFVTINAYRVGAQHAAPLRFGEISNGTMTTNEFGLVVQASWEQIPDHFVGVENDAFIVMPNHFHGIIIMNGKSAPKGKGTACRAPTGSFGKPISNSLPTIIRSFKSEVTRQINGLRQTPGSPVWQRNYYEHVIRDETELNQTRQYTLDNPSKWAIDRDNPEFK